MSSFLLTIAIPTYNRAEYLDYCLGRFTEQLIGFENEIEFIVSNNSSTDNTREIVEKYNKQYPIVYYENDVNKGADFNIVQCFQSASGKYVWIFGDDDFILPNRLKDILIVLRKNEVGLVYLDKTWFHKVEDIKVDTSPLRYKKCSEPLEFIEFANWWITFTTGSIINKELVVLDLDTVEKFKDTYLIQLSWIIPAVFSSGGSLIIENQIIACKSNNTGGYKFFQVFAINFNLILNYFIKKGYNPKMKYIINTHLLTSFFPSFLDDSNKGFSRVSYESENIVSLLVSVYWSYPIFWKRVFPSALRYQFPVLRKIKQLIK